MTLPVRIILEGLLVLCVWGFFGSQKILCPPRQELDLSPQDEGIDAEPFTVTTQDGIRLSGWWMPHPQARGVMVGCHGYGASKADLLGVTRFIQEAGYSLVLFDFRRHGESGGRWSTLGKDEIADLEAVLQWVGENPKARGLPVGLYGFSMGAAVAIRTAARHPDIRVVISDNAFIHLAKTIRRHHKIMYPFLPTAVLSDTVLLITEMRIGSRFSALDPGAAIASLETPIYFIHSAGDRTILVEEVKALFESAREPKKLWIAETEDHMGASAFQEQYEKSVLGFLNEHLDKYVGERPAG